MYNFNVAVTSYRYTRAECSRVAKCVSLIKAYRTSTDGCHLRRPTVTLFEEDTKLSNFLVLDEAHTVKNTDSQV